MKIMEFHEVANIFPLMEGAEFESLVNDIKENGLLEPIWMCEGKIIDGRNRYNACQKINIEPTYKDYDGDNPLSFVISLNLKRRHLNESQRAVIASRLANMKRGGDRPSEKDSTFDSANLPIGNISQSEAAEMMNVSERMVRTVKSVEREAPELISEIESGNITAHEATKKTKAKKIASTRMKIAEHGAKVPKSDKWNVYLDDINTWTAPREYDFIVTDPPYPKEYLPLYKILSHRSSTWLKDGGLLIAMCGQSYLDEIYEMMSEHMTYYWTAAYLTPGQPTPLRQVNVNTTWKPLLIFRKGNYTGKIFGDVFKSDGNDKELHKWGQSESGMFDIISKICLPGQYILDPFCGAGTTLVAGLRHGCIVHGVDLDEENVKISKGRLDDTQKMG